MFPVFLEFFLHFFHGLDNPVWTKSSPRVRHVSLEYLLRNLTIIQINKFKKYLDIPDNLKSCSKDTEYPLCYVSTITTGNFQIRQREDILNVLSIVLGARSIVFLSNQMQSHAFLGYRWVVWGQIFNKNACRRYIQKSLFMWRMWFQACRSM